MGTEGDWGSEVQGDLRKCFFERAWVAFSEGHRMITVIERVIHALGRIASKMGLRESRVRLIQ